MIRVRDISLPPEHDREALLCQTARALRVSPGEIRELTIVHRSVDARKKPDVKLIYTVDVTLTHGEGKAIRQGRGEPVPAEAYCPPQPLPPGDRPVVVGFGPGGMFAALVLALAGQRPLVLERGEDALTRREKVEAFFRGGALDPESNVPFGEGGAGTFSDGKLNTGVNNPRIRWILGQFVEAGASEEILYDAKPHVGTDVLVTVVRNIREKIRSLGGEVRFQARVTGLEIRDGCIAAVRLASGETVPCHRCILAIGHSARDTFRILESEGVPMEAKPFAMGVRIEHLQREINISQYGKENPALPPADYKLSEHIGSTGVFTFCMCPGGYVVAASSQEGGIVTNGMSNHDRAGENANAALLVSVRPEDFPYPGALGGVRWQREIEERAYRVSGSYRAPAQTVGDFLEGKPSAGPGRVVPTYRPGVVWCDLSDVLPEKITAALREALPKLGKKLHGFDSPEAVLTAPETRSSSPVRILRDDTRQSAVRGLYPVGEGAGYAGGIMSAAIDGMLSAEAILDEIRRETI